MRRVVCTSLCFAFRTRPLPHSLGKRKKKYPKNATSWNRTRPPKRLSPANDAKCKVMPAGTAECRFACWAGCCSRVLIAWIKKMQFLFLPQHEGDQKPEGSLPRPASPRKPLVSHPRCNTPRKKYKCVPDACTAVVTGISRSFRATP